MRFIYYICFALFFIGSLFAETPEGYYDSASSLSGEELKSALHDIIDGHTEISYDDVWNALKDTDKDPYNSENVILLYTGWSVNAAQEYNNGQGWNREHVWAQSHGDFGTATGTGTDVHNLRPCDISVNSSKSNNDFDNGGVEYIDPDGGPTGCYRTTYTWEPRETVKGDVARMIFYMATRYEGDLGVVDYAPSSPNHEPVHGVFSTLMEWHVEDPVDEWEENRNDIIYEDYQHNRNPFIDHPEYVDDIWGETTQEEIPPTIENITISSSTSIIVNFSETVDETTSENTSNYSLGGIGNPSSAVRGLGGNNSKITLSTSSLTQGNTYTLTINNVEDLNSNIIDSNSQKEFQYLAKGAIAIIGTNSDYPDDFAFVVLTDLLAGTEIRFTDSGWLNTNAFRANEGAVKYLAPNAISSGTLITYLTNPNFTDDDDSIVGTSGFQLSTSGDQILAFQGASSSPSFIHAINFESSAIWQSDATSPNTSALPYGLTNSINAVALLEFDNMMYNDVISFSSPSEALLSICDYTNWIGDDTIRFTFFPPNSPQNLTITIDYPDVILNWDAVTEDTDGNTIANVSYKVYTNSIPDFPIDPVNLLSTVSDSTYIHIDGTLYNKMFYKVSAQ